MAKKSERAEQVAAVRAVLGEETPEMDIIRALHMAGDDPTKTINILLDLHYNLPPPPSPSPSPPPQPPPVQPTKPPNKSIPPPKTPAQPKPAAAAAGKPRPKSNPAPGGGGEHWWLVGSAEMAGLSTCKGRRIAAGEPVTFSFPNSATAAASGKGRPGRFALASCTSEIMRFSTPTHGEVGRIPNEWARCLLPLLKEGKVKVEALCKSAPEVLSIMDTVLLSASIYINSSMFRDQKQSLPKATRAAMEDSTFHPLPALFKVIGITPFMKAAFTPEDLYSRKRPIERKSSNGEPVAKLTSEKLKLSSSGNEDDHAEGTVSDSDLDDIIGISDSSALEERDPPEALQCDLRPYQKQALHWMLQLEKGSCSQDAATTLHPCWEAYKLDDKREFVLYLNVFSGDATTEFPSTLQLSRGGILADAMGLGKTIMTISLLLSDSSKGRVTTQHSTQISGEASGLGETPIQSLDSVKNLASPFSFSKIRKLKAPLIGGGNLVICPMTLLSQWKAEIEAHTKPNSLNIYVHYGQSRPKEASFIGQNDIVLTTYGVVASEFSTESSTENGGLYSVHWFRIVLDEAHMIKSSKSLISQAAAALTADRRWCLTGTPIQNNLEDLYSLFRFLKVEPWRNWALWNKLVQKPFEEGDERGLKLVQTILKPVMLRRTKHSTDKEGRPILTLPPANIEVKYCDLSESEKDFYEALFRRSKVKFDQFVEQGKVLHNYASILELLLRLRQCCDHPFLVMSRGDTQEFADLNKLAKRFLHGGNSNVNGDSSSLPSKAYIEEVVQELQKGEGECPICLEAFEDAVLTPCAHRLCRECILSSWQSPSAGLCPVCRKSMTKQDLITAPTNSRFQVDVEKNWVESSKISFLLQELESLRSSGAKSIVFSQWTAFLDLLEIPLSRHGISFTRLDGTLNLQQRERVIREFSEDKRILVLLMSLKAGGVGINLTAASNAFVMDPWWNPAVEEQAVMRIHRIGQTKSVSIKRFIVKGTVEERMEAVQARKQRMISGALTDQEFRTARLEELKMLFS
ncbi:DNA repair protein RAD5A [Aegilops tauschii subsp. strangulata]|uniref:SWI/SNF-related matrix-associated actin-dependent regulator of chromatin subfamily A member 3-like 2 n=8 Tax=Aegilops tauschii subsp. strangulata TaxID=200361 RepID=A0A453NBG6_AEGTS|nr:DNA repair protein RAD5A isoform X1 [Aegilops tauschii subsp. strangulata]